jgi:hypothetical protein
MPPEKWKIFNKDVKKKPKYFAGVAIICGFIRKVASSFNTRRDYTVDPGEYVSASLHPWNQSVRAFGATLGMERY